MDKKSQLYRLPDNKVLGEDMRQNLILNYVNAAENVAKSMILKERLVRVLTMQSNLC